MAVWIVEEKCTGCGRCLAACPYGAVELVASLARFSERCTMCGACVASCRDEAILTDAGQRPALDFSGFTGVWVVAEVRDGALAPVSLELLGGAASLAQELGQGVEAVLLGRGVGGLAQTLIAHGAKRVHVVEHELLSHYLTNPFTKALAQVVKSGRPNILLIGATPSGRDLAPRLARRLALGLTADCTKLSIDPEEKILLQTRPAFGGNVMATIATRRSRPQMATVRPGVMAALPADGRRRGEVVPHQVKLTRKDLGAVLLEVAAEPGQRLDLTQARVIVAGGRGVGSVEGFGLLKELAAILGGEVGGTRVAVEEGWIEPERQIGQTGVTVRPELYVACGLSGAIQHRAGMSESRYVVAINKAPEAAIFEVADFGLVGDYKAIVPALIKAVKEA